MEDHHASPSPICTLKVDITCCEKCPIKLKKKLMKTNGVIGVDIDSKHGTVRVVGDIDPMILMQMFEKMGKPAELWSFHKVPSSQCRTSTGYNNSSRKEARSACDDDFSGRDYNHDNEYDPKRGGLGPGPCPAPMEGGGGFGWRGGFAPSNSSRFSGVFPNPMYCPGPPPSSYYRQPPPPFPPRSTYGGYGYGYFPSRSTQKFNPMTHYNNYWDNYRLSP